MIDFIVALEIILENSGTDYEIIYCPDTHKYILRLNDFDAVSIQELKL